MDDARNGIKIFSTEIQSIFGVDSEFEDAKIEDDEEAVDGKSEDTPTDADKETTSSNELHNLILNTREQELEAGSSEEEALDAATEAVVDSVNMDEIDEETIDQLEQKLQSLEKEDPGFFTGIMDWFTGEAGKKEDALFKANRVYKALQKDPTEGEDYQYLRDLYKELFVKDDKEVIDFDRLTDKQQQALNTMLEKSIDFVEDYINKINKKTSPKVDENILNGEHNEMFAERVGYYQISWEREIRSFRGACE